MRKRLKADAHNARVPFEIGEGPFSFRDGREGNALGLGNAHAIILLGKTEPRGLLSFPNFYFFLFFFLSGDFSEKDSPEDVGAFCRTFVLFFFPPRFGRHSDPDVWPSLAQPFSVASCILNGLNV